MCWLSEPLPSGLLADAKHRRNLSPGTSVGAGLGDVVGESEIDGDGLLELFAGSSHVGHLG